MIKIENIVTPSPEWWDVAIKGMRNSYKATDKSDSFMIENPDKCFQENKCNECPYQGNVSTDHYYCWARIGDYFPFVLGKNDKNRLLNLCAKGTSHRKVLRQLPVVVEITAPLYWWKQMDQYKLGTVTNSESTMHTLTLKEFEVSDFSIEHIPKQSWTIDGYQDIIPPYEYFKENVVDLLNDYRKAYLETNDINYWHAINEFLPQSYNQKRTLTLNYETILNIIQQRKGHRLQEWDKLIECFIKEVPYLDEIVKAVNEGEKEE